MAKAFIALSLSFINFSSSFKLINFNSSLVNLTIKLWLVLSINLSNFNMVSSCASLIWSSKELILCIFAVFNFEISSYKSSICLFFKFNCRFLSFNWSSIFFIVLCAICATNFVSSFFSLFSSILCSKLLPRKNPPPSCKYFTLPSFNFIKRWISSSFNFIISFNCFIFSSLTDSNWAKPWLLLLLLIFCKFLKLLILLSPYKDLLFNIEFISRLSYNFIRSNAANIFFWRSSSFLRKSSSIFVYLFSQLVVSIS